VLAARGRARQDGYRLPVQRDRTNLEMKLVAILLLCSCTREAPWPAWPEDREAARALTNEYTLREPGLEAQPVLTAERVAEHVRVRTQAGETRVGWPAIVAYFQERVDAHPDRPFYLLWGNYHDAPAQIAALARVIGPLGVDAPWLLVAEPFAATGRWVDLSPECQRGDELLLAEFRHTGSRDSLQAIYADQHEENHTAWRYGVLDAMVDLVVTARASRVPILGCDLPTCVRERLWDVTDDESMRTRELHCAMALRRTLGAKHSPERVAMLWGLSHVHPDGVSRFLPRDADVVSVQVIGGRQSDTSVGSAVAHRHGFSEPVLLPLEEPILLLPDRWSFARRVRKRDGAVTPPGLAGHVYAFSTTPGELIFPGGRVRLDIDSTRVPVQTTGHLPFVFVTADRKLTLVGGLELAEGSWAEIEIEVNDRLIVTAEHPPDPDVGHSERL